MPITSKSDYHHYLEADLLASGIRDWKWYYRFTRDVMYFTRVLRWAEYLKNCVSGPLARNQLLNTKWRLRRLGRTLGLEIPINVFEPGLNIVHPYGIVVSRNARVGANCRVHAGVNIGEHRGRAPEIGDNVYLGPGAKIVGGISIGSGAVIGANAVVTKDVPPSITVGGVPARKLSDQHSSYLIPAGRSVNSDELLRE